MEPIQQRITDLIRAKGLRGGDLASATSVNASTISRILRGSQIPTAETLYKIAQFLDVTMEYLLTGIESSSEICMGATLIPEEKELIEHYRHMNSIDKEDLLMIAEMKAGKNKKQYTK